MKFAPQNCATCFRKVMSNYVIAVGSIEELEKARGNFTLYQIYSQIEYR